MFYRFFDQSEPYNQYVVENKDVFDLFLSEYYDSDLGWNTPRSRYSKHDYGCYGSWEAHYNADGSRNTCNDGSNSEYDIILVGDSFTHGDEASDCTTYPSILQKLLQVSVGNFGVFAYNSIQSVIQYEKVLAKVPSPQIGVLGITFENGRRNLNSFFPLFFNRYEGCGAFFFSPYFDGYQIMDPVIKIDNTFDNYQQQANKHFAHGFWSKPKFRFPFSLRIIQFIKKPYFKIYFFQYMNKLFNNPTYSYDYQLPIITNGIRVSVDKFIEISNNYNVKPIVIFIPAGADDLTSPKAMINEFESLYPEAFFLNFGDHDMDWSEYTLSRYCHPTAKGYKEIAKFLSYHIETAVD